MTHPGKILDSLEADQWSALYRCRYDLEHRTQTIPVLAELLNHPDPQIHQRALRAVGRIGPCDVIGALSDLVPLVCAYTRDSDLLTRRTALGTLFGIARDCPKVSVPALVEACEDDQLLDTALLALIELGKKAKPAVPCFHKFATHHKGKIRRLAIRGLGVSGAADKTSQLILQSAREDSSKEVRELAKKLQSPVKVRRKK